MLQHHVKQTRLCHRRTTDITLHTDDGMSLQPVHQARLQQTTLPADSHIIREKQRCRNNNQFAPTTLERKGNRTFPLTINRLTNSFIPRERQQRVTYHTIITFEGVRYQLCISRNSEWMVPVVSPFPFPPQRPLLYIFSSKFRDIKCTAIEYGTDMQSITQNSETLCSQENRMPPLHQSQQLTHIFLTHWVLRSHQYRLRLLECTVALQLPHRLLRDAVALRHRRMHHTIKEHTSEGLPVCMTKRRYPHELR